MRSQNIQNKIRLQDAINCDLSTAYIWMLPVMVGVVSNIINFLFSGSFSQYFTLLLYSLEIIIFIKRRKQCFTVCASELLFIFIIILSVLLTLLLFPENSSVLLPALSTSYLSVMFYLAGKATRIERIDNLYIISVIGVVIAFINILILHEVDKDMTYSYTILPYILVSIHALIHHKKFIYFVGVIAGVSMLFLLSTRGSLLLALIYICYTYISNHRGKWRNIMASIVITLGTVIYFQSDLYRITLLYLYSSLETHGIHNQMLYNFYIGSTASTDNRIAFLGTVFKNVFENPFLPHGLCGDRLLLQGRYVHNIIGELLYSYGAILGSALIILCVSKIVSIQKNNKDIIVFLLFAFLGKLFFSSSFIIDSRFYFMIGIMVSIKYMRRTYEK